MFPGAFIIHQVEMYMLDVNYFMTKHIYAYLAIHNCFVVRTFCNNTMVTIDCYYCSIFHIMIILRCKLTCYMF